MNKLGLIFAFGVVLVMTGNSFAQRRYDHNINRRQANQEKRIQQGVANGSLMPKETERLERQESRISELEAKDRASGGLSPKERAELEHRLNSEDHRIYRQKHDGQGTNPNSRNINERQGNQTNRIEQGVANGSLTPQETYRLEKQESRISELEARDRASGGKLSGSERAELNGLLNSESHRIYVQKHDGQTTNH